MKEELDKKLIEILDSTVSTFKEGTEFVLGELPDVIYQLLLWYGVYNGILTLVGLIIIGVLTYILVKFSGQGEHIREEKDSSEDTHKRYKITFTHDSNGEINIHTVLTVIISSLLYMYSLALINLTWLKILIAPKIWLIEYTATLVKG